LKAYLSRRYHFSASHRLHSDGLSVERNLAAYGKCNNPHGHGHNYAVEVTYSGPVDEVTGMVANLGDLDRFARERVLERFDLTNLNELDLLRGSVPTTENLAVVLQGIFSMFTMATLERVRVEETANNSFEVGARAGMD
jgi:6-pyruvoyltetrahydropterin/6-carboxytetrahydropterin synthase